MRATALVLLGIFSSCAQAQAPPAVVGRVTNANNTVTVRSGRQTATLAFTRLIIVPKCLPADLKAGEEIGVERDGHYYVVMRFAVVAEQQAAALEALPEAKRAAVGRAREFQHRQEQLGQASLSVKTFRTGDVGKLPQTLRVLQVLGDSTLRVKSVGDSETRYPFVLKGVSTRDLVEDKEITLGGLFEVRGTERFETALGGTRTLFVLAPYAPDRPKSSDFAELERFERSLEDRWRDEIEQQRKALDLKRP